MTSQLVVHIEGYPDEVTVPGTALLTDFQIPSLEGAVRTTSVTAELAGNQIDASVTQPSVEAVLEVIRLNADDDSQKIDADFGTGG